VALQLSEHEEEARVFGPTKYIVGVHTPCERIVNGKRCNKHHLRRDCEQQPVYAGADGRLSFPLTIGTIVLTPVQTAKLTTEQRRAVVLAVEHSFPSQLRSQSEGEMMDKLNVWAENPDVLDVAFDTGATPSMVLSIPSRQPAQPREIMTIQSTEQPPMAVTVGVNETDIVWIQSPYSAANVRFLKSHHARWCSDRNCWYMMATSSGLDVVLERFDSCGEPSRTDAGWQVQEIDVHEALLRMSGSAFERRRQLHQASQAAVGGHATVSADVIHVHGALRCRCRIDVHPPHAHGPVASAGDLWCPTVRGGW
jgi:hypothetical protein